MKLESKSPDETLRIGEKYGRKVKKGLICLYGPLGAGKTTFIRGLARGLGVKSKIQSPTFTYERIHSGRLKLYHFDCYRISKPDILLINDLHEAIERDDGIIVIEWAERIADALPEKRTEIHIEYGKNGTSRKITCNNLDL